MTRHVAAVNDRTELADIAMLLKAKRINSGARSAAAIERACSLRYVTDRGLPATYETCAIRAECESARSIADGGGLGRRSHG
jgi:hypothetical protein